MKETPRYIHPFFYEYQNVKSLDCFLFINMSSLQRVSVNSTNTKSTHRPSIPSEPEKLLPRGTLQQTSIKFLFAFTGWDDWSDFTACSVMCGKGVQQRFRRCLLDNPNADTSEMESRVEYYHPSPSTLRINGPDQNNKHNPKKYGVGSRLKKRRKKKGKVLSTQSCEGYNIEQRNCNVFECSGKLKDSSFGNREIF